MNMEGSSLHPHGPRSEQCQYSPVSLRPVAQSALHSSHGRSTHTCWDQSRKWHKSTLKASHKAAPCPGTKHQELHPAGHVSLHISGSWPTSLTCWPCADGTSCLHAVHVFSVRWEHLCEQVSKESSRGRRDGAGGYHRKSRVSGQRKPKGKAQTRQTAWAARQLALEKPNCQAEREPTSLQQDLTCVFPQSSTRNEWSLLLLSSGQEVLARKRQVFQTGRRGDHHTPVAG